MADHSAGHISTKEGSELIGEFAKLVNNPQIRFYPVSDTGICVSLKERTFPKSRLFRRTILSAKNH
jgi:hypothetical protein